MPIRAAWLSLLLAPAAAAQIGGPAPELDPSEWYLSRPLSLAELRGRTVLLVSLRTWSEPCKGIAQELNSRWEADGAKGLAVIGLFADEEPRNVERWIGEQRARFPVVLLASREFEFAAGLDGFPHAAVVDPIGTLVYGDDYGRSAPAVAEALARTKKPAREPAKLARVRDLAARGEYEAAWGALAKLGKLAGAGADEAGRWRAYLAGRAATRLARAKALAELGALREAVETLDGLENAKPPYPDAADVRAFEDELAALPRYREELAAGEDYAVARERERSGAYLLAVKEYREIQRKHATLRIAAAARKRADELVERGLPGFDWSCDDCKRAFKACAKHLVKAP